MKRILLLIIFVLSVSLSATETMSIKNIIKDKDIELNEKKLKEINNEIIKKFKLNQNTFLSFKIEINDKKIANLQKKSNKEKNKLLLTSYKIELEYYDLINHINYFIPILYKNEFDIKTIKEKLGKELVFLNKKKEDLVILDNDIHAINKVADNKIIKSIYNGKEYLDKYTRLLSVYENLINYLNKNTEYVFVKDIIIENFKIKSYISDINNYEISKKINKILVKKYDVIDTGRIVIFLASVIFFWLLKFVIIFLIFPTVRRVLSSQKNEAAKIIEDNLNSIKRPISYLLILIGIEIGVKIIFYPQPPSINFIHTMSFLYIASGTILLLSISNVLFMWLFNSEGNKRIKLRNEIINLSNQIFKFFIISSALVLFLLKMNVEIVALVAPLGMGGMAIAFAARDTISNLFGGIKIIIDSTFSQGDWIKNSKAEGTVVEIGLISTKVRTFDNAMITVPNGVLANEPVLNWNKRKIGRRIKTHVGITYDSKREDVKQALIDIKTMLSEHKGIAQPKQEVNGLNRTNKLVNQRDSKGVKTTQLVYLDEMADSSINILIYCFTRTVNWEDWLKVKEDVFFKIWEILDKNNLEYAFPSQTIYLKEDGE
jgi:MscS family membrane protein